LLPHEIKTYFPFGGDKVFFDKDDIKALKAFGSEPGLVVFGFKPATTIADVHNLRSPYFVYPNEVSALQTDWVVSVCGFFCTSSCMMSPQSDTIGGTTAFIALHSQMMAMNKVAIARIIMRAGTAPRLVALVAQVASCLLDFRQAPECAQ
jgi:ATP-dependent DNA helicase 2 subunit 1